MQTYFAALSMSSQRGSMVGLWRDRFLRFQLGFDGRGDVSRFHGNLSKLSRGVVGEDVVRRAERIAGRVVRSRPRDQRPV
jgi:hypothetical protein